MAWGYLQWNITCLSKQSRTTGFINCFLKEETKFISNTFNHRPISRAQPAVRPEVTEDSCEDTRLWSSIQQLGHEQKLPGGPGAAITTPCDFLSSVYLELKVRTFPGWDFSAVTGWLWLHSPLVQWNLKEPNLAKNISSIFWILN